MKQIETQTIASVTSAHHFDSLGVQLSRRADRYAGGGVVTD
jgi:hypothetical protein